ncbi:Phosphotransferase KptA/Tpt1 [Trinorchestia longiramus]|nr:Phosphotransferase KptA/Tpt1 [Trinorchestia longiramus]
MSTNSKRVKLSKALSFHLRHGGERQGVPLDPQGWANLNTLLNKPQFYGTDVATIKDIVLSCPKQRFALKEEDGQHFIRANQGHSLSDITIDLEELHADTLPEILVHGTYMKHWNSIKTEGLSRMRRQHIHLAAGLPGQDGVISGMRTNCQLHIFVDGPKALVDGYKFFKSANNVILCPGSESGFLPPKYFAQVIDTRSGAEIPVKN